MERLEPYLGMILAVIFGVLIIAFSSTVTVVNPSAVDKHTASSTLSVVPNITSPSVTVPNLVEPEERSPMASSTQTAPTPKKKVSPAPQSTPTPIPVIASIPVPIPPPPPSSGVNASLDVSASALRSALVNILCYVPIGSGMHSMSGSGVFIDPKGIILTNAHVAQYFLLADRSVSCTVRAGSPATNSYEASLIYISPAWLQANSTVLTQTNPRGTGENDFALLAITKSSSGKTLPSIFPSLSLATVPPITGTPVVIASYGAQFIESSQIQSALFPTVVFGSVKDVFTFAVNTIDILALGGSAAAQEGSSGGGVANSNGELVGTITTSTTSGTTDTRSLDAITASYIRAEYASETGSTLELLLAKPISTAVADFAIKIPALESILTAHLP